MKALFANETFWYPAVDKKLDVPVPVEGVN
jgi:hypothetical protein